MANRTDPTHKQSESMVFKSVSASWLIALCSAGTRTTPTPKQTENLLFKYVSASWLIGQTQLLNNQKAWYLILDPPPE